MPQQPLAPDSAAIEMSENRRRILLIVGTRPNFVKIAPICHEINRRCDEFVCRLIHTGQHFDSRMSQLFFDELSLSRPDANLGISGGTPCTQIARMLVALEEEMCQFKPHIVVVVGDVTSTLAGAITANKNGIPIVHVEAGLRSYDLAMPEEVNRKLVDQLADLLLTSSPECESNLEREGISKERVRFVGNVMIDTLKCSLPAAKARWPELKATLGVDHYALATLHRPSNVDDVEQFRDILTALESLASKMAVIFPVHPRTAAILEQLGYTERSRIRFVEPFGYLDFLALQAHAEIVLTDSGGVQEETTVLGIRCLTLRANTERPVTISLGTNELVDPSGGTIFSAVERRLSETATSGAIPPLWDGNTAERIVDAIDEYLSTRLSSAVLIKG